MMLSTISITEISDCCLTLNVPIYIYRMGTNFEGSIFRGFEESSLIRNFRGYI